MATLWNSGTATWDDLSAFWAEDVTLQNIGTLDVELYLNGVWTNISEIGKVRYANGVQIVRGRSDIGVLVQPTTCNLTLDNRDGRFSPRNPNGAYNGLIGRNTPIRASIALGTCRLVGRAWDTGTAYITTPDNAALDITGDIDVRADVYLYSWRRTSRLTSKSDLASGNRSWVLQVNSDGKLSFYWSADGSTTILTESTVPIPLPTSGRKAVRATLDVNNGSGGNTVTFYTSTSLSGSWTQLGDPVVTAGTTSIFSGNATVDAFGDFIYGVKVMNGIAGTEVANPDFTSLGEGTISFSDSAGRTWSISGSAIITNRHYRFVGEVSSWPQKWDSTGSDVYVDVTAAGILRRLSQGATPIKSAMYRGLTRWDHVPLYSTRGGTGTASTSYGLVAYYPAEDAPGSTSIASAITGAQPLKVVSGTPSWAASTEFACSAPLPTLANSDWRGALAASYAYTSRYQVRFLLDVPEAGMANNETIIAFDTAGTAANFSILHATGGDFKIIAKDRDDNIIEDSGALGLTSVTGKKVVVSAQFVASGSHLVQFRVQTLEVGATAQDTTSWISIIGYGLGRISNIYINPGGGLDDTGFGHLTIQNINSDVVELVDILNAYAGETAGRRIERLCEEEGIDFRYVGDIDDTQTMGAQGQTTLKEILEECSVTDGGVLYEPRDFLGLAYRTQESMIGQSAVCTLVYDSAHFSSIEPVDDDLNIRNDITVNRKDGSSYHIEQTEGPLSTNSPPDGVGRYDDSVQTNVQYDYQLPDRAGWLLLLGTVDEVRYPEIGLNLSRSVFTDSLIHDVLTTDIGDRIDITNLPSWLPPDDSLQIVQGNEEVLDNFQLPLRFKCSPATPWNNVGIYGTDRYSSDGSELTSAITSGATSVSVTTPTGPVWSHADGNFDIRVGGEVMTVTAISGTSSPQTFTVTRGVNGVQIAHSAGDEVQIDNAAVYGV